MARRDEDRGHDVAAREAMSALSGVREELFRYSWRTPAFAKYVKSKTAPSDAACVRWLIRRIDELEDAALAAEVAEQAKRKEGR